MAKTIKIYDEDAEKIDEMVDENDEMSWAAKVRTLVERID